MTATNRQVALHLLSIVEDELQAGLTEQAVSNFCRAYALQPRLSTCHLVALPSCNVQIVVSTLEDWCTSVTCACGLVSDDMLKQHNIPMTWEQICDVILLPDLAPHSLLAWSLKIKYQMQEERYSHVVATCTKALKTFEGRHGERCVFWAQRGLAYVLMKHFGSAVTDYLSAFQDNPTAFQLYVTKCQSGYASSILDAFYDRLSKLNTEVGSEDFEGTAIIELYQFILIFEKDPRVYGDCACHMMKQHRFKDAVELLSVAIQYLPGNSTAADKLQLFFLRAECYLVLDDTDMAVAEYVAAASLEEDLTRLAFQSLPLQQQSTLVARAKRVASDILVQCQINSASKATCSLDAQSIKTKLDQAAGFFQLLHIIDEHRADELYSAAECRKLLGSFTEAIALFSRFLSLWPKSCDAYYERASCYMECGDEESALNDYNASVTLQPAFVQALCGRAWLWLKKGEPGKAVADLTTAHAVSTVLSAFWIQELPEKEQVDLRTKLTDFLTCATEAPSSEELDEKSLAVCDVMVRAWPKDVPCHLLHADILVALKKMDEAQAVLVELLKNDPDEPMATARLAALRLAQGRVESAMDDFVALAKRHGEEKLKTVLSWLKEEQRTEITRAAHCEGAKRVDANLDDLDAEALFTVAVSAAPREAWESYFSRAKVRWQLNNLETAIADCTAALTIKRDCEVFCWRALVFLYSKKQKAACIDLFRALLIDSKTLKSFVMSRCKEEKSHLLIGLESCLQWQFVDHMRTGTKINCIILLCRLMVHLGKTSSLCRSNYADALIINNDYRQAAEQLELAARYGPEDLSVVSRSSSVYMILSNVDRCVDQLSYIAEVNSKCLEFTFTTFNEAQKLTLASESISRASLSSCDDNRALLYYTIAAVAVGHQDPEVLRMRSQCLLRLRCYKPAIEDLSAVIAFGPRRIEDLCARANLHLLNGNSRAACDDFIAAMEMNNLVAKDLISTCPAGKDAVHQLFINAARDEVHGRSLRGGLKICNYGLTIEPTSTELAQLKAQLEHYAKKSGNAKTARISSL